MSAANRIRAAAIRLCAQARITVRRKSARPPPLVYRLQLQANGIAAARDKAENANGLWLPLDGSVSLDDMDSYIIRKALQRADNNVTAAARLLGTTRQTLRYRIQKYKL